MTLLTLFSAPKPFTDPHIATIQRNAVLSWRALGNEVQVILIGEEAGLAEAARDLGVQHVPQVARNASGTPLVSDMFARARQHSTTPLLCCINADILATPSLLQSARRLSEMLDTQPFLAVGQRWDVNVRQPLDFSEGWDARLEEIRAAGTLHRASGSDYFLFPRTAFTDMPPFAIGRAGWDNWMIFQGRYQGWKVIDATQSVTILHQQHDYHHLPGGKPHYHLPESNENVRLAGGRRTILELPDANWELTLTGLRRRTLPLAREMELFPLVRLHSYPLAQLTYALFHPVNAYRDLRAALRKR